MVKMIFCLRRRPDLTPEAFRRHWRDIHAPIVARHAATLGIKRYVQVHALDLPGVAAAPDRPEPFDGVGEVWIESVEAFRAAAAAPGGAVAVRELGADDALVSDLSRSPRTFGTEIRIFG